MSFFKWFFNFFRPKEEPISVETPVVEETPVEPTEPVVVKTPKKRALLVGVDKYAMPGSNLNGCVNDVWDMYDLLTKNYSFNPDDIRVIVDERATFQNIEERLRWLIDVTEAGDESVFYHSGHGSQCRDRNGDELVDRLDEYLISHDHDWDNPFIDDILCDIFKQLNKEAFLTVIVDTCHSGTITRGLIPSNCGNPEDKAYRKEKFIVPPFDILARSLDRDLERKTFGARSGDEEEQRHVLLSGCKESETSKELRYGNEVRGAMTFNLTKLLRSNPDQTWENVHKFVHQAVKNMQNPELRGKSELKSRKVFGGK